MINVTRTYLPPLEQYEKYLRELWDNRWVTNNGKFVQQLEADIKNYLGVKHFFYCTNGTVVLQMAIKALKLKGKIITTPFSYVATVNSILWEQCEPVFMDVKASDCCIDEALIEKNITADTSAILATHVYGNPCHVEAIKKIADRHNLKVIYDGAHAFGTTLDGKQLLSYGDVSTCSFHATKLFHTIEGGGIMTNDDEVARQLYLFRQFGHVYDEYFSVGINAKNSEFHAAMGLCLLPEVEKFIAKRTQAAQWYDEGLRGLNLEFPKSDLNIRFNNGYYPIVFESEKKLLEVVEALKQQEIIPRRYFYPSLNTLHFIRYQSCPVSESISTRVLCLPLFYEITKQEVELISGVVKKAMQ